MRLNLNRKTLLALMVSAVAFTSCGDDKEGKKAPERQDDSKKNSKAAAKISDAELAARGSVYASVPKSYILKVKLDKDGKEVPESAKIGLGKLAFTSNDSKEIEKAFAEASAPDAIVSEKDVDSFDGASDVSTDSFRARRAYRNGFNDGYYMGSNNYGSAAVYPGYYSKCGRGRGCYYNGYVPVVYYQAQPWYYAPQSVCNSGGYRYYTYAAQGSSFYQSSAYQTYANAYSYNDSQGYYGSNGYYTSGNAMFNQSSYNTWNSGTGCQSAGCGGVNNHGVGYPNESEYVTPY